MVRKYLIVRTLRKHKKISQKQMAELIGIHLSTYARKERGESQFTHKEIIKVSQVLCVKVEHLLKSIEIID